MDYNSQKVLTAWKTFVGKGILMEDCIRPEIARSWKRCKEKGVDPWSVNFPKPVKDIYMQKRKENETLLKLVQPILQYIVALFNCNVSLVDKEGLVFELVSPLDSYSRTIGTIVDERITGTGAVTITLEEKIPVRIDGFEHYRMVSQGYSGVSAPINVQGEFIGVITMTNPLDSLPDYALDCCIMVANLISDIQQKRSTIRELYSTANLFKELIEFNNQATIVLDDEARILLANKVGKKIVDEYENMAYGEQSIGDYLISKAEIEDLVSLDLSIANRNFTFKKIKNHKETTLALVMKRTIYLPNGLTHIVLIFEIPSEVQEAKNIVKLRSDKNTVHYIGKSAEWKKVDRIVHKVAGFNANVLLLGETGTGKEVVARTIHRLSKREGEFVAINCGAIPKDLFASELFGYEGGAFTGAKSGGQIGKIQFAEKGTLFLDEIGELPLEMQVGLLRVLQEKTVTRIGSNNNIPCDVRIIAATNQNINKMVEKGTFRSDLYYRLSIIEISLPLLNQRKSDISLLADHFNKTLSEQLNIAYQPIPDDIINKLEDYNWPGNVRELRNVVEKMLIFSEGNNFSFDILPTTSENRNYVESGEINQVRQVATTSERDTICISIERNGGNLSSVAKELGIARNTLYRKLEKYNIEVKASAIRK